jgi:hypothetical protein
MSHPQNPYADGPSEAYASYGWTAPAPPSWAPPWQPPAGPPLPPVPPARSRDRRLLVPVLAGVGGVLAGAVLTGVVLTGFDGGGEAALAETVREEVAAATEDMAPGQFADPDLIERFDPLPPTGLGTDAALDRYAQDCFEGDLQACDDLYFLSTPMSGYEEYAVTCGGRTRAYALAYCPDFE